MDEMINTQTFDQLRSLGHHALASGQVEEALHLLEQAIVSARESGEQEQIDLALCNRSSVAIALGEEREVLGVLRPILLRSGRADVCFLAADGLSRAYELGKEFKKGLFYARASLSYAERTGRPDWIASGHNQSGNCLTGTSHFEAAYAAYGQARKSLEDDTQRPESMVVHTGILVNLGYCKMMLGSIRRGMGLSFRALRIYRRLGTRAYDGWPHLDLSYGYLELGHFDRARQHAEHALRLAEETRIDVLQKNALFLLGETEKACGRYTESHAYFARLQGRYYPQSPQLLEVLSAVGLRQVVNLRA
jgi:tetratricopeptide (TPR) repeat protein